jgi:putative tricarboxylic transport membrane protein
MTTQRSADIISGIFLAVVGAVVIVAALDIQSTFGERLPPRTLPLTLGLTTLITGALLSIRSYRYQGEDLTVDWPDREGWARLIVTFISLAIYLVLIEPLGVPIATLIFSTFLIWYLDRKFVRSLAIGVITAVVIEVVFVRVLQLSFPAGFWAH